MSTIEFIDTTVRDGQGSLWATSMRTSHLRAVLPALDQAGFEAIEFLAPGSRLKKFVRELHENPWEWIHAGVEMAKNTPLRWHGSIDGEVLSGKVPPEVGELLTELVVNLGIKYTRVSNNWNNYSGMAAEMHRYERLGMTPVINVIYSVSPRHTDEYYVQKASEAAALNPYRLCFKDVDGILTPERAAALVPKLLEASPGVVWEFHGHCNNGLGQRNALACVDAGIHHIHTALPPLAEAESQPSCVTLADNLRYLGHDVNVDTGSLKDASRFLRYVARREGLRIGSPNEFRLDTYRHQVPGGMMSNLRHQLGLVRAEDRLNDVLIEIERVRREFGYPIMVTPLSQFVGAQATLNVLTGSRYRDVPDSSIEYALGMHGGSEATEAMDGNVRDVILDRPRTAEVEAYWRRTPPSLADLRARLGGSYSDEEIVLLAIVGDDALDAIGEVQTTPYSSVPTPLAQLVAGLLDEDELRGRRVTVTGTGFKVSFSR